MYKSVIQTVTSNIRNIIQKSGIKQKAVAEKAGYSEKAFSAMLTGRKVIKADDIVKISNALLVEPNDIFGFNRSTVNTERKAS